ncbi:RHS repeat-associated core domain-containing protein, partial [Chryseobacterium sp. ON_d1]|uniref:RHS repeat-associated core domain-containing protein n=1 Tax=Chryseobacterium sp. ON_d1 TaxID=2583211 RepID=UPI0027E405E1
MIIKNSIFYRTLSFGGDLNINGTITPSYRYSTQGQEKQIDTKWSSYRWRNYDAGMARFFNVDPLSEKYNTWLTYAFSGNRVVDARELEGLEPNSVHGTYKEAVENFGNQYNNMSIRMNGEIGTRFYKAKNANG